MYSNESHETANLFQQGNSNDTAVLSLQSYSTKQPGIKQHPNVTVTKAHRPGSRIKITNGVKSSEETIKIVPSRALKGKKVRKIKYNKFE